MTSTQADPEQLPQHPGVRPLEPRRAAVGLPLAGQADSCHNIRQQLAKVSIYPSLSAH